MRLNAWVSIVVFCRAIGWFVWLGRHASAATSPGLPGRGSERADCAPMT